MGFSGRKSRENGKVIVRKHVLAAYILIENTMIRNDEMKITHEERFSEMEMFGMFNIAYETTLKDGTKRVVNMWKETRRKLTRGEAAACQDEDNIKPGISQHRPGSQRVADLAKFYAENAEEEKSAFFV